MFLEEPCLEILPAPDKWALVKPARWESKDISFTLPIGWVSDLASIPRILRNILDVNGRSRNPALAHDWLYNTQKTTREFADEQLRLALLVYGERSWTARTYWLGVRAGGWVPWDDRQRRGGGLQPDDFVSPEDYRAALESIDISLHPMP